MSELELILHNKKIANMYDKAYNIKKEIISNLETINEITVSM